MARDKPYSKNILGVKVDFGWTMNSVLNYIERTLLKKNMSHLVCTTNPEFVIEASENPAFREIINSSVLSVPDGTGVLLAEEYLKRVEINKTKKICVKAVKNFLIGIKLGFSVLTNKVTLGERITGVELVDRVCQLSSEKGYSVFFLGGWPQGFLGSPKSTSRDIASEARDNMLKKYPNANIVGGTSSFSYKPTEDSITISYIKECLSRSGIEKLDFLFVAYGQYKQESWILRNSANIPAKISVGVGRTFNYYSDSLKMPPRFCSKYHLEWLYTLMREPWRFRRIMRAFPGLPYKVYISSLKNI